MGASGPSDETIQVNYIDGPPGLPPDGLVSPRRKAIAVGIIVAIIASMVLLGLFKPDGLRPVFRFLQVPIGALFFGALFGGMAAIVQRLFVPHPGALWKTFAVAPESGCVILLEDRILWRPDVMSRPYVSPVDILLSEIRAITITDSSPLTHSPYVVPGEFYDISFELNDGTIIEILIRDGDDLLRELAKLGRVNAKDLKAESAPLGKHMRPMPEGHWRKSSDNPVLRWYTENGSRRWASYVRASYGPAVLFIACLLFLGGPPVLFGLGTLSESAAKELASSLPYMCLGPLLALLSRNVALGMACWIPAFIVSAALSRLLETTQASFETLVRIGLKQFVAVLVSMSITALILAKTNDDLVAGPATEARRRH